MKNNTEKISIQDLVSVVAKETKIAKKDVEMFLKVFQETIEEALENDKIVKIKGFGTFKIQWNEARKSVNVRNGEEYVIPGHYKLSFTPETQLKEKINAPYLDVRTFEVESEATKDSEENQLKKLREQAAEIKELLGDLQKINKKSTKNFIPQDKTNVNVEKLNVEELSQEESEMASSEELEKDVVPIENYDLGERVLPIKTKKKKIWKIVEWFLILGVVVVVFFVLGYVEKETLCFSSFFKEYSQKIEQKVEIWGKNAYFKNMLDVDEEDNVATKNEIVEKSEPTKTIVEQKVNTQSIKGFDNYEARSQKRTIGVSNYTTQKEIEKKSVDKKGSVVKQNVSKPLVSVFDKPRVYSKMKIIAIEPLRRGSRLTLLAEKYYGSRDFWVYLYEANCDKISNPDDVGFGTPIKIPELDKDLIDANNPACIEYARELYKKYKKK